MPATILAYFAFLGALTALDGTSSEDGGRLTDAFLILGFVFGVVGMLGMWVTVVRRRAPVRMLIAGLIGIACGYVSLGLVGALAKLDPFFAGLSVPPAIVAVAYVVHGWTSRNAEAPRDGQR